MHKIYDKLFAYALSKYIMKIHIHLHKHIYIYVPRCKRVKKSKTITTTIKFTTTTTTFYPQFHHFEWLINSLLMFSISILSTICALRTQFFFLVFFSLSISFFFYFILFKSRNQKREKKKTNKDKTTYIQLKLKRSDYIKFEIKYSTIYNQSLIINNTLSRG